MGVSESFVQKDPVHTELDQLPDSLMVRKVKLRDTLPPMLITIPRNPSEEYQIIGKNGEVKEISSPIRTPRPLLLDPEGNPVRSKQGGNYFLGEGGLSNFTNFTTDDGLALDNVTSSLLDEWGNMWFGTWGGGLSKFDGISFTNYTTAHGLSTNLIHCLAQDAQGNIWVGTDGGGVSIFNGDAFVQKSTEDGLGSNIIYGITKAKNGDMWLATGEGGVSKFDGTSFTTYNHTNGLPGNSIIKIEEAPDGFIWIATGSDGLVRFDGENFLQITSANGLADDAINCLFVDKSGHLWVGTGNGGVSKYMANPNSVEMGTFENYSLQDGLANNDVWDITQDHEGNLWFATAGGGVSKYDGRSFTNFTTLQGLPENFVYTATVDRSGYLWLGTAGGGVSLYKGPAFINFNSKLGLGKYSVYGIEEDNQGNLWFTSDGGGITRFDGASFLNYSTAQGLPNSLVICVLNDQNGNLWLGTGGGGLVLFEPSSPQNERESFTLFNEDNGLPSQIIYSILKDRNGDLWLGTGGAGLIHFDWRNGTNNDAGFTSYSTSQGLAANTVYGIEEDHQGNLWAGTSNGVSKFDGQSITNYSTEQGLANPVVWSILEDPNHKLWFATQRGVSRFDGEAFETFNTGNGLIDNTVYDLIEDEEGNLFIGTNRGFTVIPSTLTSVPFDEIGANLEYFNTSFGYPVKDVNKGMHLDGKGNIWAGNGSDQTGLVKFNYRSLQKKTRKPIVNIHSIALSEDPISWSSVFYYHSQKGTTPREQAIKPLADEVSIFGNELDPYELVSTLSAWSDLSFSAVRPFENVPENLTLPYARNQISIDFSTDELVNPNMMEYRYILEGFKGNDTTVTRKNTVTFSNLWEGDYSFRVQARFTGPAEEEGKEWSSPAVFSFTILSPWYRTWWAYLAYVALLLCLIRLFYLVQKKRFIARERERTKDLALTQAKEIEKAYADLKATQAQLIQQEKLASLGQLAAGIAHEIKNPLNFVNNFSEVSLELLEEALEELSQLEKNQHTEEMAFILADIETNLKKINNHGTRANGIVTSMLQHSRSGSGEMQASDINSIVKEFVNLAFHGMRAGKNPINVDIKMDLDEQLPQVQLNPEDFSRVLLNLCNNAFDAMREKVSNTQEEGQRTKDLDAIRYEPRLNVVTMLENNQVRISIEDNGPGIPDEIKDKILQPFFTTKKGTDGTGLGLSISHDIIKAHGGTMNILSSSSSGTTFTISLPIS
jgi:signal transduction histidine kinase/streptogramin lyase